MKFTTSRVDVTVEQTSTGESKSYVLAAAAPGEDLLAGRFDRDGFEPTDPPLALRLSSPPVEGPRPGPVVDPRDEPEPPVGPWLTDPALPGFRVKARITSPGGKVSPLALEPGCIGETACVSGAVPGRSELFVRIVGPKPNGRLWPTLVRFTTSRVEVWIEQETTGDRRFYLLEGASPGSEELNGRFDRLGFLPPEG